MQALRKMVDIGRTCHPESHIEQYVGMVIRSTTGPKANSNDLLSRGANDAVMETGALLISHPDYSILMARHDQVYGGHENTGRQYG